MVIIIPVSRLSYCGTEASPPIDSTKQNALRIKRHLRHQRWSVFLGVLLFMRRNDHPADQLHLILLDWRERIRSLEGLETQVLDLLDQLAGLFDGTERLVLVDLAEFTLVASAPRSLDRLDGLLKLVLGHIVGPVVAEMLTDLPEQLADVGLDIQRVGLLLPLAEDVRPGRLPRIVDLLEIILPILILERDSEFNRNND